MGWAIRGNGKENSNFVDLWTKRVKRLLMVQMRLHIIMIILFAALAFPLVAAHSEMVSHHASASLADISTYPTKVVEVTIAYSPVGHCERHAKDLACGQIALLGGSPSFAPVILSGKLVWSLTADAPAEQGTIPEPPPPRF